MLQGAAEGDRDLNGTGPRAARPNCLEIYKESVTVALDTGDALGIEGGQVVVFDAEGNIPDDLVVKYFIDRFPNRNQEWTSADGLWVAINIPPGDWFINAFVADGAGGHKLMGSTSVKVFADSINISSVYLSYGNGISYPDDCFSALEE